MFGLQINAEKFSFERVDDSLNDERIFCAHVNTSVARAIYLFVCGRKKEWLRMVLKL